MQRLQPHLNVLQPLCCAIMPNVAAVKAAVEERVLYLAGSVPATEASMGRGGRLPVDAEVHCLCHGECRDRLIHKKP